MTLAGSTFRWLDILENEFDRAFVELDVLLAEELDVEQTHITGAARDKMTILCSAFAQLADKAQTIFQTNTKLEAQLHDMRERLVDTEAQRDVLDSQYRQLLFLLHEKQLQDRVQEKDPNAESTLVSLANGKGCWSPTGTTEARCRAEISQLKKENALYKDWFFAVQNELFGAQLAAKYLDKELAGRIQQLQLLARDPKGEHYSKLWNQLEAEINLHRHKTIVQACRQQSFARYRKQQQPANNNSQQSSPGHNATAPFIRNDSASEPVGDADDRLLQEVCLLVGDGQSLGLEVKKDPTTKLFRVSSILPDGIAAQIGAFHEGDAVLSVNGVSLEKLSEEDVAQILRDSHGQIVIQVLVDDIYCGSRDNDVERRRQLSGIIRKVEVLKNPGESLGLSVTGGYEHGVPILISDVHKGHIADRTRQFMIGDAILSVNGRDLRTATHKEAAEILRSLDGTLEFELLFVDPESDTESLLSYGRNHDESQGGDDSLKALSPHSETSRSLSPTGKRRRWRFPGRAVEITEKL